MGPLSKAPFPQLLSCTNKRFISVTLDKGIYQNDININVTTSANICHSSTFLSSRYWGLLRNTEKALHLAMSTDSGDSFQISLQKVRPWHEPLHIPEIWESPNLKFYKMFNWVHTFLIPPLCARSFSPYNSFFLFPRLLNVSLAEACQLEPVLFLSLAPNALYVHHELSQSFIFFPTPLYFVIALSITLQPPVFASWGGSTSDVSPVVRGRSQNKFPVYIHGVW